MVHILSFFLSVSVSVLRCFENALWRYELRFKINQQHIWFPFDSRTLLKLGMCLQAWVNKCVYVCIFVCSFGRLNVLSLVFGRVTEVDIILCRPITTAHKPYLRVRFNLKMIETTLLCFRISNLFYYFSVVFLALCILLVCYSFALAHNNASAVPWTEHISACPWCCRAHTHLFEIFVFNAISISNVLRSLNQCAQRCSLYTMFDACLDTLWLVLPSMWLRQQQM